MIAVESCLGDRMTRAGMCDCCYNITKQLAKKAEFLWHSNQYLKDAKKAKHKKCVKVLEKVIADEKKHVKMLKDLCKDGIC